MKRPAEHQSAIFADDCSNDDCDHKITQPTLSGEKVRYIRCKECGRINRLVATRDPDPELFEKLREMAEGEWIDYYDSLSEQSQ